MCVCVYMYVSVCMCVCTYVCAFMCVYAVRMCVWSYQLLLLGVIDLGDIIPLYRGPGHHEYCSKIALWTQPSRHFRAHDSGTFVLLDQAMLQVSGELEVTRAPVKTGAHTKLVCAHVQA